MLLLKEARLAAKYSQRTLATRAGVAYKSLQLIESGQSNPSVDILQKIAEALGLAGVSFRAYVDDYFRHFPDSIFMVSRRLASGLDRDWKVPLLNCVDALRRTHDYRLIHDAPCDHLTVNLAALLASVVETLCHECDMDVPPWCAAVAPLPAPWFVAGMQSLKATALVESPVHFRKRNIFVLGNMLERA